MEQVAHIQTGGRLDIRYARTDHAGPFQGQKEEYRAWVCFTSILDVQP